MGKKKKKTMDIKSGILGIVYAMAISIFLILLFAIVIKTTDISEKWIMYFNQGIKIIGIICAVYFGCKKALTVKRGAMYAVGYIVTAFLVFSLVNGGIGNVKQLLLDLVLAVVVGSVFAFIWSKRVKK